MSRTYNTRPYWVQSRDKRLGALVKHNHRNDVCDIDGSRASKVERVAGRDLWDSYRQCHWELPRSEGWFHLGCRRYSGWDCELILPSKNQIRMECRQAVKEFNATGEINVDIDTSSRRRCVGWIM